MRSVYLSEGESDVTSRRVFRIYDLLLTSNSIKDQGQFFASTFAFA